MLRLNQSIFYAEGEQQEAAGRAKEDVVTAVSYFSMLAEERGTADERKLRDEQRKMLLLPYFIFQC
jgi:hypothetical protein